MYTHEIRAVSIAAPAFNEAAGIRQTVWLWLDYLRTHASLEDFEIVICDDGSKDSTGAILDELAVQDGRVKPVHHEQNQGAASALATAIRHTTLPWILLIDSDGQYDIKTLDHFISMAQSSGERAVIGVRIAKQDSVLMRFGSWISGALCNWFHHTRYQDFNCALKLVDGPTLRALSLEAKGLNYSADITSKLVERNVRLAEVNVEHQHRSSGRSSAQSARAAVHRFWFVLYLGFRQFLLRNSVLRRPS